MATKRHEMSAETQAIRLHSLYKNCIYEFKHKVGPKYGITTEHWKFKGLISNSEFKQIKVRDCNRFTRPPSSAVSFFRSQFLFYDLQKNFRKTFNVYLQTIFFSVYVHEITRKKIADLLLFFLKVSWPTYLEEVRKALKNP